jgi:hypothetical protein
VPTGDFRDPEWEPSEAEEAALLEDFRRTVLWRKAMAARGVKVTAMKLTPQQEHDAVTAWWLSEGRDSDRETAPHA